MITDKDLELVTAAYINGDCEVISQTPPEDLIKALSAIPYKPAREDALAILYDVNTYTGEKKTGVFIGLSSDIAREGKTFCFSKDLGVFSIVRGAKVYASCQTYPMGPKAVSEELDGLRTAMLEVAGRLKKISPTSKYCLELIPIRDEGNPNQEEVRDEYWSWVKFDMGEAFLSDELAIRLEAMAKVLNRCAEEAKESAKHNKGQRNYFQPPPIDLKLFDKCAKLLQARGRPLTNLRTIASVLFEYITKSPTSPTWAERQEEMAKRRYGTHPPKKRKGASIPD